MLNLSRLLYSASALAAPVFNDYIEPTSDQRGKLVAAKTKIRDHLSVAIAEASLSILGATKKITPRFRTQGSWAYKTCLQPAHMPPQEMDWDFGVYLPVSAWEGTHPRIAAKAYFNLVESALRTLCAKEGWNLVDDKDTCIRIQISAWAHIDVPLYAAPEDKFKEVVESAALRESLAKSTKGESQVLDEAFASTVLGQDWDWESLDQIMMATRDGEWRPSDPAAVSRWFKLMVDQHGPQLRRVCRYLKAWRDHEWKNGGGPSSVVLMICAVQAFQRCENRDDQALLHVVTRLVNRIQGEIREPAIDEGKEDFNRLLQTDRIEASKAAERFRIQLEAAMSLKPYEKERAIPYLRYVLGARVPDNVDLIVVAAADVVRNTPARHVAAPQVNTTKAG